MAQVRKYNPGGPIEENKEVVEQTPQIPPEQKKPKFIIDGVDFSDLPLPQLMGALRINLAGTNSPGSVYQKIITGYQNGLDVELSSAVNNGAVGGVPILTKKSKNPDRLEMQYLLRAQHPVTPTVKEKITPTNINGIGTVYLKYTDPNTQEKTYSRIRGAYTDPALDALRKYGDVMSTYDPTKDEDKYFTFSGISDKNAFKSLYRNYSSLSDAQKPTYFSDIATRLENGTATQQDLQVLKAIGAYNLNEAEPNPATALTSGDGDSTEKVIDDISYYSKKGDVYQLSNAFFNLLGITPKQNQAFWFNPNFVKLATERGVPQTVIDVLKDKVWHNGKLYDPQQFANTIGREAVNAAKQNDFAGANDKVEALWGNSYDFSNTIDTHQYYAPYFRNNPGLLYNNITSTIQNPGDDIYVEYIPYDNTDSTGYNRNIFGYPTASIQYGVYNPTSDKLTPFSGQLTRLTTPSEYNGKLEQLTEDGYLAKTAGPRGTTFTLLYNPYSEGEYDYNNPNDGTYVLLGSDTQTGNVKPNQRILVPSHPNFDTRKFLKNNWSTIAKLLSNPDFEKHFKNLFASLVSGGIANFGQSPEKSRDELHSILLSQLKDDVKSDSTLTPEQMIDFDNFFYVLVNYARNGQSKSQRRATLLDRANEIVSQKHGGILKAQAGTTTKNLNTAIKAKSTNSDYKADTYNDKPTDEDIADLVALCLDASALGLSGFGLSPWAAIAGAAGSISRFVGNAFDGVSWGDVGEFGLDLGLDALTLIPFGGAAASAAKLSKKVKSAASTILKFCNYAGIGNAGYNLVDKAVRGEKMTWEDWDQLLGAVQGIANIKGLKGNKIIDVKVKDEISQLGGAIKKRPLTPEENKLIKNITDPDDKAKKLKELWSQKGFDADLTTIKIEGKDVSATGKLNKNLKVQLGTGKKGESGPIDRIQAESTLTGQKNKFLDEVDSNINKQYTIGNLPEAHPTIDYFIEVPSHTVKSGSPWSGDDAKWYKPQRKKTEEFYLPFEQNRDNRRFVTPPRLIFGESEEEYTNPYFISGYKTGGRIQKCEGGDSLTDFEKWGKDSHQYRRAARVWGREDPDKAKQLYIKWSLLDSTHPKNSLPMDYTGLFDLGKLAIANVGNRNVTEQNANAQTKYIPQEQYWNPGMPRYQSTTERDMQKAEEPYRALQFNSSSDPIANMAGKLMRADALAKTRQEYLSQESAKFGQYLDNINTLKNQRDQYNLGVANRNQAATANAFRTADMIRAAGQDKENLNLQNYLNSFGNKLLAYQTAMNEQKYNSILSTEMANAKIDYDKAWIAENARYNDWLKVSGNENKTIDDYLTSDGKDFKADYNKGLNAARQAVIYSHPNLFGQYTWNTAQSEAMKSTWLQEMMKRQAASNQLTIQSQKKGGTIKAEHKSRKESYQEKQNHKTHEAELKHVLQVNKDLMKLIAKLYK